MNRKIILITILICTGMFFAGCNSDEVDNVSSSAPESAAVQSSIESSTEESSTESSIESSIEESSSESSAESSIEESSAESSEESEESKEGSESEGSSEQSEDSGEQSEKSAEPQIPWQEQYIKSADEYIKSISDDGAPQNIDFELLDIDQDGKPELIIATEDESYYDGIIFSFADGKATDATEHIVINQKIMYNPQSRQIALLYGRSDYASLIVGELKDGYFERVLDASCKLITPESPNGGYYHIDGRDVSKDQFDSHVYPYLSTYTEFNSNWTYVLGKKTKYSASALKAALSNWPA